MSRTVARALTAIALGGLTSLTMISPAQAVPCPPGTYPPGVECTPVTLTDTVVAPGETLTVTVTGFGAGTDVTFAFPTVPVSLGSFTTDASGSLTASLRIPSSLDAGTYVLTASGVAADGSARILSSTLTVTDAGSDLPLTGFEIGAASVLGVGLLGAGTLAVASGRKRKRALAFS